MTKEQAETSIKFLESMWSDCEFDRGALRYAIEALEKQIPIPKHKYMGFRCICGKEVAKNQDYCEYCGQKLLPWKEVE